MTGSQLASKTPGAAYALWPCFCAQRKMLLTRALERYSVKTCVQADSAGKQPVEIAPNPAPLSARTDLRDASDLVQSPFLAAGWSSAQGVHYQATTSYDQSLREGGQARLSDIPELPRPSRLDC